jgi:DNA-binding transcriptional LysR family regulator
MHSPSFPDFRGPAVTANIGWLGLQHILETGGSGYFPVRLVRPHLASGRLVPLQGAPEFSLPAYMVYAPEGRPDFLEEALQTIRDVPASEKLHSSAAR